MGMPNLTPTLSCTLPVSDESQECWQSFKKCYVSALFFTWPLAKAKDKDELSKSNFNCVVT